MNFILSHFYILITILLAVSSQLIIKWKMSGFSFSNYQTWQEKFLLALSMLFNPYILLALFLTFFSGLTWMIAMTKFEISYAYPFTTLGLILITIFSIIFFNESINIYKFFGIIIVCLGVYILSKGMS